MLDTGRAGRGGGARDGAAGLAVAGAGTGDGAAGSVAGASAGGVLLPCVCSGPAYRYACHAEGSGVDRGRGAVFMSQAYAAHTK